MLRKEPENGRKILHGMPEDVEHAIAALRHSGLRDFSLRVAAATGNENAPSIPPAKKYTRRVSRCARSKPRARFRGRSPDRGRRTCRFPASRVRLLPFPQKFSSPAGKNRNLCKMRSSNLCAVRKRHQAGKDLRASESE